MKHLLALHHIRGMGNVRLRQIIAYFNHDYQTAWDNISIWADIPGLPRETALDLAAASRNVDPDAVYEQFQKSRAKLITWDDPAYPPLLHDIYQPPLLLFYLGQLPDPADICLAMVGSRRATSYGRQVAKQLAGEIAAQGIWIVSGLARGIDGICHQAAIDAGSKTVAVLGSGIDVIYPPEHRSLYQEICLNGAVISELPLGMGPLAGNFPARNRIISGLSQGVIVIEAGLKSGTRLTVDCAAEQGRDIFAVPGPITSSLSEGTNTMLAEGARVVTKAEDVWGYYIKRRTPILRQQQLILEPEEEEIIKALGPGAEPRHFDALALDLGWPAARLAAGLTILEIKGIIEQLPGKYYIKAFN